MKRQLLVKTCAVAAISMIMFSCKKEAASTKSTLSTTNSNQAFNGGSDNVYVSGFYLYTTLPLARYWMNTITPVNLTNGTSSNGHSYDLDVTSTGDVYSIGTDGPSVGGTNPGVVWKNSTRVLLPPIGGVGHSEPRMVFVNGSDIYIAGNCWNAAGTTTTACYWKITGGNTSSIPVTALPTNSNSDAFGITVTSAGAVYVAGTDLVGGNPMNVVYWTGGVETALPALGARPQIVSIGTDVYIASATTGGGSASIVLFKNGAAITPFIGGPSVSISTWSLATNGTDLYAEYSGTTNPSASQVTIWVWKNSGAPLYSINASTTGQFGTSFGCLSVGPSGHTYVAGTDNFYGSYWDNGLMTNLFGGHNNNITGIAVK